MDARTLTRLMAATRVGIGLALFAAPRTAARRWLGQDLPPAAGLLARGLGARDLALGMGQLVALDRDGDLDPWMDAGIAADAADAVAAVLGRRHVGTGPAVGTVVVAGGAAVAGWLLKDRLTAERGA